MSKGAIVLNNPDPAWSGARLREQTDAFAATAADLAPDAPVPTCPKWQARDLVAHIGQAHRWAADIVRAGAAAAPPDPRAGDPGAPSEWSAWLRAGAADLVDAVTETGPDRPVWTYVDERPAGFWLRRMLHDTLVHRADAALAAGVEFEVEPGLAADTISEALGLIGDPVAAQQLPSLVELRGTGQTLQFRPTEPEEPGWLITRTPDGPVARRANADADVLVSGPVRDLLLVFSRRRPPSDVTVTGDAELLDHWLARTAF
ncbi:MAG TPA: maleylpyruvate isomerase family mycothiol-dependent enzyme [Pseudonocardiaceae bacterium]